MCVRVGRLHWSDGDCKAALPLRRPSTVAKNQTPETLRSPKHAPTHGLVQSFVALFMDTAALLVYEWAHLESKLTTWRGGKQQVIDPDDNKEDNDA